MSCIYLEIIRARAGIVCVLASLAVLPSKGQTLAEYVNRAAAEAKRGAYKEAISDYTHAIELTSDSDILATCYTNRGNNKSKLDEFDSAISDFDQALKLRPKVGAYFGKGFAEFMKLEEKVESARRHREEAPGLEEIRKTILMVTTCFGKAIEADPRTPIYYYFRGEANSYAKFFARAIPDYDQAITLQPDDAGAYLGRSRARLETEDYDGAVADAKRAQQLDPENDRADEFWHIATERRNKEEKKQDSQRHFANARVAGRNNNATLAMAELEKAIKEDPELKAAYRERGMAKWQLGDIDGALADADKAVALTPAGGRDEESLMIWRGAVRITKRDWGRALADFRRAEELLPNDHDFLCLYVWIARAHLGEEKKARAELAAYLSKHKPTDDPDWSGPGGTNALGRFLTESISELQFLGVLGSYTPTPKEDARGPAWYIVGLKRLFAGNRSGAKEAFQNCLALEKSAATKDWTELGAEGELAVMSH